jgi:hypothetical protein
VDPDRLAELEEERRFLLRSLVDLEREHAAGDVDDADYATLKDGYTARAADVLRSIEEGRAALPPPRPRRWGRIVAAVAAVIAVAVGTGVLVARSSGQRLPGQEITGGGAADDAATLLARARQLLGVDPVAALDLYDRVLQLRPDDPEALAYSGWLLVITSRTVSEDVQELAIETGTASLRRAAEVDPTYADPRCFLAIIAANFQGDPATARTEADACLANDPPADMRALLAEFVSGLDDAPSTTAVP